MEVLFWGLGIIVLVFIVWGVAVFGKEAGLNLSPGTKKIDNKVEESENTDANLVKKDSSMKNNFIWGLIIFFAISILITLLGYCFNPYYNSGSEPESWSSGIYTN